MQYRYPKSYEHRKAELERRLRELLVDYRRLMQFIPQIPDQIGEPFSGPLDPIQFQFFPEINTGGTNTGGTLENSLTPFVPVPPNTGGTLNKACEACPFAAGQYQFTISGVTNNGCSSCTGINATHTLSVTGIGTCQWATAISAACMGQATMTYGTSTSGVGVSGTGDSTALTIALNFGFVSVTRWRYRNGGCPPPVGQSMTLVLEDIFQPGGLACDGMPTEIVITGV